MADEQTISDIYKAWQENTNAKSAAFAENPTLQTLYDYVYAVGSGVNSLFQWAVIRDTDIAVLAQRVSLMMSSQSSTLDGINDTVNENITRLGDEIATIKKRLGMATGQNAKRFGR